MSCLYSRGLKLLKSSCLSSYYLNSKRYISVTKQSYEALRLSDNKFEKYIPAITSFQVPGKSPGRKIDLSPQQCSILLAIASGKSVFITGCAGSGKSYSLKYAIEMLKKMHGPNHIAVTASTEIASFAINGQTLHTFAGVSLDREDRECLLDNVASNKAAVSRWRKIKVLIINDVSKIDGEMFDTFEYIARMTRKRDKRSAEKLWGGIQLIVTGDFFELPPIKVTNRKEKFAFEADCWNATFEEQFELTEVFRKYDLELIELLLNIRRGEKKLTHIELLYNCLTSVRKLAEEEMQHITALYLRDEEVSKVNDEVLRKLGQDIITYKAVDEGSEPWKSQLSKGIAVEELNICVGARVMLVKHLDQDCGLVNGTTGLVVDFIKGEPVEQNKCIYCICKQGLFPRVKFDTGMVIVVTPSSWDIIVEDVVVATRRQIPLMLGSAISIHKSQGMTVPRLHVDISKNFGYGMLYVALSRVKSLDGLHLTDFEPSNIKAHPKVVEYYRRFSTSEPASCSGFNLTKFQQDSPSASFLGKLPGRQMNLTSQQFSILLAVASGKSVFITGSAGTGKSCLLNCAIKMLKEIYGPNYVAVTASTGIAAFAINGQTLHSFAGMGIGLGDRERSLSAVANKKSAVRRWRKVKALIIEEVSMINGEMFDTLEYVARMTRKKKKRSRDKLWGGIQLIVAGDFFQLPPIEVPNCETKFAFEADCWNATFEEQFELTEVFRQSDHQLIELLQGIRRGEKNSIRLDLLLDCLTSVRKLAEEEMQHITTLYPKNEDVSYVNEEVLRKLGQTIITYTAADEGFEPWKSQLSKGIAAEELNICVGAKVILVKNLDQDCGLVNGASGVVIGFDKVENVKKNKYIYYICKHGLLPRVKFDTGMVMVVRPGSWDIRDEDVILASRKQIPLILGWAISVHKCQGMTISRLHTDLSKSFGYGMVYVALSRVKSLDGLYLTGFNPSKIKAHPKVVKYYKRLSTSKPIFCAG